MTCPERSRRIVITGGHLTPALAVIEEMKASGQWEILFLGRKKTMEGDRGEAMESQIIPQMGCRFQSLSAGRWQRRWNKHWPAAFLKIPVGFFQAFYHLACFRPEVILSFGGYLALPVVFSGWLLGIPIVTHEQSLEPGLANRLIARLAKKVAVSWQQTRQYFPSDKVIFTGNPLRQAILQAQPLSRRRTGLPVILITGGNQGAHAINEAVRQCLASLLQKYVIYHQSGTVAYYQDYEKLKIKNEKLKTALKKRYHLKKWFSVKELAEILSQADLVVSRAGMNIISELIYFQKPALLIPLFFGREQQTNAVFLANLGLAKILLQADLTPKRLAKEINAMIKKKDVYQSRGRQWRQLVKSEAARKIVAELERCGR